MRTGDHTRALKVYFQTVGKWFAAQHKSAGGGRSSIAIQRQYTILALHMECYLRVSQRSTAWAHFASFLSRGQSVKPFDTPMGLALYKKTDNSIEIYAKNY